MRASLRIFVVNGSEGLMVTPFVRPQISRCQRITGESLDVKLFAVKMRRYMDEPREDHIDRFLRQLAVLPREVEIDLEVEAIVDRIGGINRRIKRGMERTLAEHELTHPDWQVLTSLRLRQQHRSSPGALAAELELSSGAMTSRLDRLAEAGLVSRLPDPEDRRGVMVELTDAGRETWDRAASVQARREAFFASALSKDEQRELNALLRKLMLAFEDREAAGP
jgi:DNA-binding MarR family transcriptional regulator